MSWWRLPDSNWGHKALQASALPTELKRHVVASYALLCFLLLSKKLPPSAMLLLSILRYLLSRIAKIVLAPCNFITDRYTLATLHADVTEFGEAFCVAIFMNIGQAAHFRRHTKHDVANVAGVLVAYPAG
jgi:hypothetical protein